MSITAGASLIAAPRPWTSGANKAASRNKYGGRLAYEIEMSASIAASAAL
jgi:hypothetical protein